eukprot:m.518110 g.518110  ORF g.518110 m.518110 type:complete len:499 (+) comp21938_c0_seq4:277-1773(+)
MSAEPATTSPLGATSGVGIDETNLNDAAGDSADSDEELKKLLIWMPIAVVACVLLVIFWKGCCTNRALSKRIRDQAQILHKQRMVYDDKVQYQRHRKGHEQSQDVPDRHYTNRPHGLSNQRYAPEAENVERQHRMPRFQRVGHSGTYRKQTQHANITTPFSMLQPSGTSVPSAQQHLHQPIVISLRDEILVDDDSTLSTTPSTRTNLRPCRDQHRRTHGAQTHKGSHSGGQQKTESGPDHDMYINTHPQPPKQQQWSIGNDYMAVGDADGQDHISNTAPMHHYDASSDHEVFVMPNGRANMRTALSDHRTIIFRPAAVHGDVIAAPHAGSPRRVSRISIISSTASNGRPSRRHTDAANAVGMHVGEGGRMDRDAETALLAHLQAVSASSIGVGSPGSPRVVLASPSVGIDSNSQREARMYTVQQSTHSDSDVRWDEDDERPGPSKSLLTVVPAASTHQGNEWPYPEFVVIEEVPEYYTPTPMLQAHQSNSSSVRQTPV